MSLYAANNAIASPCNTVPWGSRRVGTATKCLWRAAHVLLMRKQSNRGRGKRHPYDLELDWCWCAIRTCRAYCLTPLQHDVVGDGRVHQYPQI